MTETTLNTIQGYLNHCIDNFYSKILAKYNFKLVSKQIEGMGGLCEYENDSFSFKIINDRGVVDGILAPMHNLSVYFDLGILYGLVCLENKPNLNHWDKRQALSKNLSCEEEAAFIDLNYEVLKDSLSLEKYTKTQANLKEIGIERGDILFGK